MSVLSAAFHSWAEIDLIPLLESLRESVTRRSGQIRDELRSIKEVEFQSLDEMDYTARVILHALRNNEIDFLGLPFHTVVEKMSALKSVDANYYDRAAKRFLQDIWLAYERDCKHWGSHRLQEDQRFLSSFFETIKLVNMKTHKLFQEDVLPRVQFKPVFMLLFLLIEYALQAKNAHNLPPAPPRQAQLSGDQAEVEEQRKKFGWLLDEGRYTTWRRSVVKDLLQNVRQFQQADDIKAQQLRLERYGSDQLSQLIKRCQQDFDRTMDTLTTQHTFAGDMKKALAGYSEKTQQFLIDQSVHINSARDMSQYNDTIQTNIQRQKQIIQFNEEKEENLLVYYQEFEESIRRVALTYVRTDLKQHRSETLILLDAINKPTIIPEAHQREVMRAFQDTILEQQHEDVELGEVDEEILRYPESMIGGGGLIIAHLMEVDIANTNIFHLERLQTLLPRYRNTPLAWRKGVIEEIEKRIAEPEPKRIEDRAIHLYSFWRKRQERRDKAWKDLPVMVNTLQSNHTEYLHNLDIVKSVLSKQAHKKGKELQEMREKVVENWREWKKKEKANRILIPWVQLLVQRLPRGGSALITALTSGSNEVPGILKKQQQAVKQFVEPWLTNDKPTSKTVSIGEVIRMLLTLQWLWLENEVIEQQHSNHLKEWKEDEEEKKEEEEQEEEDLRSVYSERRGRKRQRRHEEEEEEEEPRRPSSFFGSFIRS
jgi:hypothetical protein